MNPFYTCKFRRVPQTTLRFDNSLDGLTEFMKTVISTSVAYYRERRQIKLSQGKKRRGQSPEGVQMWRSGHTLAVKLG